MLGIYNQNFNNMYINQNYGFSQSVMNFSQQSSVFSNFRNQQSSFNLNSLMSFFGSNINHSVKRNTSHKKPVTVDQTTVTVEPKKEPVHGYTALHQSLAWGEASAQKMWSLYDANKDGRIDAQEFAADGPPEAVKEFKFMDRSNDGFVNSDEFYKAALQRRDDFDFNRDGKISKQEYNSNKALPLLKFYF